MKVVVAHNRYRSDAPSGENHVVDAEIELLEQGGVAVVPFLRSSDDIGPGVGAALRAAPGAVYSRSGVRDLAELLDRERPDVLHIHNVYPLLSPAVIRAAGARGVPVVQTVHNYRLGCVNGQFFRDGQVCTKCAGRTVKLPAIEHGCYRGSRLQSVPMVVSRVVHERTWLRGVARFVALTPFMRDRLVEEGVAADRVAVRPTWVEDPGEPTAPGDTVLFVGRLDEAKGISLLLDAWQHGGRASGRRLRVIGSGDLAGRVEAAAAADATIEFLGSQSREQVAAAMDEAAFVVVPSTWFEGYPLVVAEALSRGRPVVTVAGGACASIVDSSSGWVAQPEAGALGRALAGIGREEVLERGAGARRLYESTSTPQRALDSMVAIYAEVIGEARNRRA